MTPHHTPWPMAVLVALLAAAGCASAPPERASTASPSAGPPASDRVPLLIGGDPVGWETLRPLLAEAAGGVVVDELALEAALRREIAARGVIVDESAVEAERGHWAVLLGGESIAAEAESAIRRRRGLGPERFSKLLWRNAALRALLDPAETAVSDAEVRLAREIRAGERFAVSGLVLAESRAALELAERADAEGATAALWVGAARQGARPWHGIVSPVDPAYPEALRRVLAQTPVGRASGVIALDEGYGLVVVHARLAPEPSAVDDAALAEEIRLRKTRLAMERLAERLRARTSVHAMDRSLAASE